ncbi:hypothetical protein BDW02DRAFT_575041 [Decorospora gaudefroyi]|uniref:Uncharacterized protein n=1 Tax=Decorospora gaudefroyi TaxID=184978 RepID=A0A6A5JXY4_9PLEO|nr:hypothetical protein BDW02DRAFT_575041 [Decorospora gaudefroyi]
MSRSRGSKIARTPQVCPSRAAQANSTRVLRLPHLAPSSRSPRLTRCAKASIWQPLPAALAPSPQADVEWTAGSGVNWRHELFPHDLPNNARIA